MESNEKEILFTTPERFILDIKINNFYENGTHAYPGKMKDNIRNLCSKILYSTTFTDFEIKILHAMASTMVSGHKRSKKAPVGDYWKTYHEEMSEIYSEILKKLNNEQE